MDSEPDWPLDWRKRQDDRPRPPLDRTLAQTFGVAMLAALLAAPASAAGCEPLFPSGYKLTVPDRPKGVRLYLFPGTPGTFRQYDEPPFNLLINQLTDAGIEIVALGIPKLDRCLFEDGGRRYAGALRRRVAALTREVERAKGRVQINIAGGVSYGGLHAMMAFASTGKFAGWFASLPVTRLDALAETRGIGDVPEFNPFFQPKLKGSRGLLAWATRDERVNYRLTEELYRRIASSRLTRAVHEGEGHATTAETIASILAWMKSW